MSGELTDGTGGARGDLREGADQLRADERLALARLRRWGGDRLVREMAELYLAQMPERVAAARVAVSRRDAAGLARVVHSMRASSAQLGASALVAACETTEAAADAHDLAHAIPSLRSVEAEYGAFRVWLRAVAGLDAVEPGDAVDGGPARPASP